MNRRHWMALFLQRLGQVAAVTILIGAIGYPLLHWHFEGTVSPWLGYLALVLGFGAGLMIFGRRAVVAGFLRALSLMPQRRYMRVMLLLCFAAHFIALSFTTRLPGEKAPDPFGTWLFFSASAMYPPGHDLLMWVVNGILGASPLTTVLFTSSLVTFASWLTYRLGCMAYGETTGRLAGLALALFPSWMLYGNFEYHLVLGTLFLLLVYLFFIRPPQGHRFWYLAGYGLILGFTCLVKPIALLFPAAALVVYLAMRVTTREAIKRTVIIGLFLLLAVSPWTIRNYMALGHFVLVSSNLGIVLHTSNNPETDGREMSSPLMRALPEDTDEVVKDRRHVRQAVDWIVDNPLAFLKLTAYRISWVWGSDSSFVDSNSVFHGKVPHWLMNAIQGVIQIAYLAMLILWFVVMMVYPGKALGSIMGLVFLCPIVHLWLVHLVCQAHGQHHMPVLPFMILLASAGLVSRSGIAEKALFCDGLPEKGE